MGGFFLLLFRLCQLVQCKYHKGDNVNTLQMVGWTISVKCIERCANNATATTTIYNVLHADKDRVKCHKVWINNHLPVIITRKRQCKREKKHPASGNKMQDRGAFELLLQRSNTSNEKGKTHKVPKRTETNSKKIQNGNAFENISAKWIPFSPSLDLWPNILGKRMENSTNLSFSLSRKKPTSEQKKNHRETKINEIMENIFRSFSDGKCHQRYKNEWNRNIHSQWATSYIWIARTELHCNFHA